MSGHDDLKARIQNVSDRISLSNSSKSASAHREVSSSIGSETPIGILSEIREGQGRILEEMKNILAMQQEAEARNQERHREMCTILLGIAEGGMSSRTAVARAFDTSSTTSKSGQKGHMYYGSSAIINGIYLLSCIMMHLDAMLQSHHRFKKIQGSDSTFFEIKDWYNMCSYALNADKSSKAGLRIPKPTDTDFIAASNVVASPVPGRRPTCDSSHISLLLSQCPEMMNTVEWLRAALIKCTGVLSPERTCRFRLISHPFVNDSGELAIKDSATLRMPNKFMHQDVTAMKATQKKEYMKLVLDGLIKPVDAIQMVKVSK